MTMGTRNGKTIATDEFKTNCLELIDEVHERHIEYIVTNGGKPIAKLVPVSGEASSPVGSMRGTLTVVGDIVAPDFEAWSDKEDQSA